MILPDVNVLVYAFRSDMPQHAICRPWLSAVVSGDARFAMSPAVLTTLVRITTNPRVYRSPSPISEALAFCDNLLDQPHCQTVQPGEQHWAIFRHLCVETDARGSIVADAWLAALAIESGCEWITFDRDYARFPGLRWSVPTAAIVKS